MDMPNFSDCQADLVMTFDTSTVPSYLDFSYVRTDTQIDFVLKYD